jgi:hypothetical protein
VVINMHPMMRVIASAYERAPLIAANAKPAWQALAATAVRTATYLRNTIRVFEVNTDSPYATATAMLSDLNDGRIMISSANTVHPLWTVRENVDFRLVHDVMGHGRALQHGHNADFSWEGELIAFEWHSRTLSPDNGTRDALFTELLGQAAAALVNGAFTEQKVAFLY